MKIVTTKIGNKDFKNDWVKIKKQDLRWLARALADISIDRAYEDSIELGELIEELHTLLEQGFRKL